jgi:hypothetical protein
MSDATAERVLVVPRDLVPDRASWYGLRTDGIDAFLGVVADHGGTSRAWRWRSIRASSRSSRTSSSATASAFPDASDQGGSDARLHDRWSIGVGGHVDPGDDGLAGGLRREWHEELVADFEPVFTPYALLNDDTDRGRRRPPRCRHPRGGRGPAVSVRETEKLSGAFATPGGWPPARSISRRGAGSSSTRLEMAGTTPRR